MKKSFLFLFILLLSVRAIAKGDGYGVAKDTNEVIRLNKQGFDSRMTAPEQTVVYASRALALAQKLNYTEGIGEAYRVMGIGNYYLSQSVKSIDNYLSALNYFTQINDLRSEGKVYNNIGNLYRDNDYGLSLEFFNKSLVIAKKLSDVRLVASLYINIGNNYYRKKRFYEALNYYDKSNGLFVKLKDTLNQVQCLQNKGVVYSALRQYNKAEALLLEASKEARQLDMNVSVAMIDVTLADIYIAQAKYANADRTLQEGLNLARIIKDSSMENDLKYTSYQLDFKREHYQSALTNLYSVYKSDSLASRQNISTQITVIREQVKQQARQKENEMLLQREQFDRVKFWSVAAVAGLLLILVGLLISNVKRKTKTNIQLTSLNAEVSRQKDNLDRINHHLEEIIDERTKDLQIKNKKLSEYSSYLSHQIRGPIATLKGLMNLENESLIDQAECIRMMNKCVSEIDDKIIEMSDMLHDPGRSGF